jgi:iron complex transport system permease protein
MANKFKSKRFIAFLIILIIGIACAIASLFIGKYPLTLEGIFTNEIHQRIFLRLRLPRTLVAIFSGFALGVCGYVFQTIFKNPLASPDVIGISSGASVGAAMAILFFGSTAVIITTSAFIGAVAALLFTVLICSFARKKDRVTIVLAGVAVHALAQTALMFLKMQADPEKQLASIEYWLMGSLNSSTLNSLTLLVPITVIGSLLFFLLYRHIVVLSLDDTQARLLGVKTNTMRWSLLLIATLMVAAVISETGLISFISLIATHIARLIFKRHDRLLLASSGIIGTILLTLADCLTRVTASEMPLSIYTSLIGAPLLIYLFIVRRKQNV